MMRERWPSAHQTAQEGRWLRHAVEVGRDTGSRGAALYAASSTYLPPEAQSEAERKAYCWGWWHAMERRHAELQAVQEALRAWDRWQGPGIPYADMVAAFERLREVLERVR